MAAIWAVDVNVLSAGRRGFNIRRAPVGHPSLNDNGERIKNQGDIYVRQNGFCDYTSVHLFVLEAELSRVEKLGVLRANGGAHAPIQR